MKLATDGQIQRSVSHAQDPLQAVQEIAAQLKGDNTALVVFFASPSYDKDELASALNSIFADTPTVGCSTAGEITPDGYQENTITGFALPANDFQIVVSCIDNLSDINLDSVSKKGIQSKTQLEELTGKDCTVDNTFALLFCDGLSMREEILTAGIHQSLNNLPLIGGSAGDGTDFGETWVYYGGIAKNDRALLILARTQRSFKTIKTEHFTHTTSAHVVTEANPEKRIVWEIDAEPAADVYARIVGIEKDQLGPEVYANHPLAVKIAGEIYVRSVQQIIDGKGLLFYCAIETGIIFYQTQREDMVTNLELAFENSKKEFEHEIIIGCDCILRQLEAKNSNTFNRVSEIMQENQVIGFSTYGEQIGSMHINQTFTGLAIGCGIES